ncbi:hypothetical protein C7B61_00275 [filamentous cyanobacterium CCP1]|nr:hypothetical protein C7B76_16785 [filamentous cyanobacterium CCP2]PSB68554.1 hypothetical protein C7B61_00275 [filamentous cyanobacterium CCP1]
MRQAKQENQKPSEPEEKLVNLCIKVPIGLRRYWAAQAKLKGITMTEVMMAALEKEFGIPNDR